MAETPIRVLVVEDSELDAELVMDQLVRDGLVVDWRRVDAERDFIAAPVEAVRGGATDYVLKHNMARLAPSVRRALREAEERTARSHAEKSLLRAQRYEGLALLASGLSHDLRNVLQPITMGASMLLELDDERAKKIGTLVQDCAERGLDIVTSMLTFARGARMTVERVKVRSL